MSEVMDLEVLLGGNIVGSTQPDVHDTLSLKNIFEARVGFRRVCSVSSKISSCKMLAPVIYITAAVVAIVLCFGDVFVPP